MLFLSLTNDCAAFDQRAGQHQKEASNHNEYFHIMFLFLSQRLTLLFVPDALLFAAPSVPAFHSGSAVSGQKRGDVPGRLRSHHAWDI